MTPAERAAWLKERRQGLGGSDAAAACGMSRWKTPYELWLDKRGELADEPESESMKWGTLLEPIVRQEYSNRTGRTVLVPNKILWHPTVPFALCNLDGAIENERRLYEGKTARTSEGWGEAGSQDVPLEYYVQAQHGLFVTGYAVADIAVLIGGSDFRIYPDIEPDAEFQEMLVEQEAAFWKLVESGTPPAPVSPADVKRRWRVGNGQSVLAPQDIEAHVRRYAALTAHVKQLEEQMEADKLAVQTFMGANSELLGPDGEPLATWRNAVVAPRFDAARFRAEQPDLFQGYLVEGTPQRRFLAKVQA